MMKKIIAVVLILSFMTVFAGEMSQTGTYDMGYQFGQRDGRKDASWLWIFAGTACNGAGMIAAYFMPGDVPNEMLIGRSVDFGIGYSDAYIKAKRWRQVMWATIGALINSGAIGVGSTL